MQTIFAGKTERRNEKGDAFCNLSPFVTAKDKFTQLFEFVKNHKKCSKRYFNSSQIICCFFFKKQISQAKPCTTAWLVNLSHLLIAWYVFGNWTCNIYMTRITKLLQQSNKDFDPMNYADYFTLDYRTCILFTLPFVLLWFNFSLHYNNSILHKLFLCKP